ncbi:MAG TPA: MotA/TolQ/ExbB proton channel family protein [Gemmatimonadaceae bacterium]|nr:MotA/TolQ/ExbB proton channel family protein [Gemmatimonadaceae bacterium]
MVEMIPMQVGAAPSSAPWQMITQASWVTQLVLAVLVLLSLISWAVMLAKWLEFRRVSSAGRRFISEFERTSGLDDASATARRSPPSPFTRVFTRAINFFAEMKPGALRDRSAAPLTESQVEALHLVLDSETADARDRLARFIPWLAMIGSVSPLIGLLGTVLGVIDAFIGIATKGSGNLSAVAPGVAEALVATAAALTVAIPAVFGYNIFANRLNRLEGELESFGTEIIAMMVREGRI